uniref:N-acetylglucosaminyl deacetylase LmbE family n=1 Tax=Rathayibacter sp. FH 236 TaxID=2615183 RepID=A0A5J6SG01_9MICO|nr:N-acetylglucosaminyl deacetylase LmbE family [Rathayibacter sp. FH 236]
MTVLVVVAHPDDETIGMGGTIARLADEGNLVHIHILAEGVSTRHEGVDSDEARRRCQTAATVLGASECSFGGYSTDGRLLSDDSQQNVVSAIEKLVDSVQPSAVFTHHPGDIHADHRAVAVAVGYVTKTFGRCNRVREVLHFEVLSSTEQQNGLVVPFWPNVFYDISDYVERKCAAVVEYVEEVAPFPHPRSLDIIRAQARVRGAQAGVSAAEAFVLSRSVR